MEEKIIKTPGLHRAKCSDENTEQREQQKVGCKAGLFWMEHILHVVAFREPTKAGGTQEGFLEENPQPLTIILPSTHFFIHMFNKHLTEG